MTDMPEVAMDVKGLCERLVNEASDGWTGDAVCVDAALAAEAASALTSLSRELAEARAERDQNFADALAYSDVAKFQRERAERAEAASASKDERIRALERALEPLARLEIPRFPQGNAGAYSIRHEDIRRARSTKEPT